MAITSSKVFFTLDIFLYPHENRLTISQLLIYIFSHDSKLKRDHIFQIFSIFPEGFIAYSQMHRRHFFFIITDSSSPENKNKITLFNLVFILYFFRLQNLILFYSFRFFSKVNIVNLSQNCRKIET